MLLLSLVHPVFHGSRHHADPAELLNDPRRDLLIELFDALRCRHGGLFTGDVSTTETPSQSAFEDGCEEASWYELILHTFD